MQNDEIIIAELKEDYSKSGNRRWVIRIVRRPKKPPVLEKRMYEKIGTEWEQKGRRGLSFQDMKFIVSNSQRILDTLRTE